MVDSNSNRAANISNLQLVKIYHQNIRSMRHRMSELLCHLSHDLRHILCITEHHFNREELAYFHVEIIIQP
jgi:hypothetical protein